MQADWRWVTDWGQYDSYVEHDQIQAVIRAAHGHHTLWLNSRNVPFDNVPVRQAITTVINRETGHPDSARRSLGHCDSDFPGQSLVPGPGLRLRGAGLVSAG